MKNIGVIKISNDNKAYAVFFIVLLLAMASLMIVISEDNAKIAELETEISELETDVENLTRQKQLYEEVIELQNQLEENLNQQIELHEEKINELLEEIENLKIIRAKVTAYSPLDNRDGQQAMGNPNRTSTGKRVGRSIAAADPSRLPYGTKLEVPGYGIVEIQDTGGALRKDKQNVRIDLFHETFESAMNFGVKDLEVKILEWGDER